MTSEYPLPLSGRRRTPPRRKPSTRATLTITLRAPKAMSALFALSPHRVTFLTFQISPADRRREWCWSTATANDALTNYWFRCWFGPHSNLQPDRYERQAIDDSPILSFDFDRVHCALARSFLVRNRCGNYSCGRVTIWYQESSLADNSKVADCKSAASWLRRFAGGWKDLSDHLAVSGRLAPRLRLCRIAGVQGSHDSDAGGSCIPVVLDHDKQGLHRCLPFGPVHRRLRQRLDEFAGIAKAAQHASIRELDRVVEELLPTHPSVSHTARKAIFAFARLDALSVSRSSASARGCVMSVPPLEGRGSTSRRKIPTGSCVAVPTMPVVHRACACRSTMAQTEIERSPNERGGAAAMMRRHRAHRKWTPTAQKRCSDLPPHLWTIAQVTPT